jgi:ketosteroid isomerase-like protein
MDLAGFCSEEEHHGRLGSFFRHGRADRSTTSSAPSLRDTASVVAGREELIRRYVDGWNAGERETDPQVVHPDVVLHSALTNATYHGYDGVRRWMAEIDDQFEAWHSSIDEFRDASEERLLALGTIHLRGRASGVEFDQPMAWLLTFAGERVIDMRTIPDHAQALEAAGLAE